MRATHTPGPWVAVKSEAHAGNPDSVRVDIHSLGAAYSPAHVASDIMSEDARLIAAAPEMLATIRDILDWYAHSTDADGDMPTELHARLIRAVGGEVVTDGEATP